MRVLVVDDDPVVRTLLTALLARASWHVETAEDGGAAIAKLETSDYDVVVSDVQMPEMGGRELLAAMRASPRLREVPVILMTATNESEYLDALRAEGATGVLGKPINPRTIVDQIRDQLPDTNARLTNTH